MLRSTSSPRAYHSCNLWQTNECRRSCSRGAGWSPRTRHFKAAQYFEGTLDASCRGQSTAIEHEECVGGTSERIAVALADVSAQCFCRGGVYRHPARFAKFAISNL